MAIQNHLTKELLQKILHNQLVLDFEKAVAGKFNNQLVDLTRPLEEDGAIEIVTPGSDEALEVLRHSTAHLMARIKTNLWRC